MTSFARFISISDIGRIALGWLSFVAVTIAAPALKGSLPTPLLLLVLAAIIAVIVMCAFGVVHQAEALAHRLGDPYGTLILTLSIVLIEVILITAVMLGPGKSETIARDSVMAIAMIIMNLVIGLALLVGGIRHGGLHPNSTGTSVYMSMLIVLTTLAVVLPALVGKNGAYTPGQQIPIVVLTLALYAYFLFRQTRGQANDFREVDNRVTGGGKARDMTEHPPLRELIAEHRREIVTRILVLLITVVPIVLLSHDMAKFLDAGLSRFGAPAALTGVIIAMIVFLPESLTAIRAGFKGEAQRVSNLCHGALVSTVGLTIPVVLIIAALTGQQVVLAESPANLLMLGVTMLLSAATFTARKITAMHGAAHVAAFVAYGVVVFS